MPNMAEIMADAERRAEAATTPAERDAILNAALQHYHTPRMMQTWRRAIREQRQQENDR